ncbi:fibronectin type III domain-containing protein [Aquimarina sediminis]|uniref:fibronectin type III domain-containing protein n=1 Tax=Aquimarina sediminis TaxID=2070536 RepID=UPI000FFE9A74|nr:fibronectin type III domain-containing protein [Aquimarina sediminis]
MKHNYYQKTTRYRIWVHTVFVLLLICPYIAIAQVFPVNVTPLVIPPYSLKLSEYATASSDKLILNLLLTDITESNRQVNLKFYVENNAGLAIQSTDVVIGANPIFLDGGVPLRLTNFDLQPYFQFQNLIGITPQQYSVPFPEGLYRFCFEVYDSQSGQQISRKSCTAVYLVLNDPPFLNLPNRGEQVLMRDPQNIIFQWTPRHLNATNVEYEFTLAEIWDNQMDPQAAFLASRPIYQNNTFATTLLYGPGETPLLPDKTYGWRVRAMVSDGISETSVFKNNGYSEIYYFTYTGSCAEPEYILAEAKNTTTEKILWQGVDHLRYNVQYRKKDTENAIWFDSSTINQYTNIYNLEPGTTYEFRVGGQCLDNGPFTYSQIYEFTTTLAADQESTYNCGITPEIVITNQDPLETLVVNEVFTAGDFPVTIKEVTGANGSFSGWGYIVVPYLQDTRLKVSFDGIRINTDYQLLDGVVVTDYDENWGGVDDISDEIDALKSLGGIIADIFNATNRIEERVEELQNDGSISQEERNEIDAERLSIEEQTNELEKEKEEVDRLRELAENEEDAEKKKELQEQAKEKLENAKEKAEKVKKAADNLENRLGISNDKDITIGNDSYFDGTIKLSKIENSDNPKSVDGIGNLNLPVLYSSTDYAKDNQKIIETLGSNKKLIITNSETTQKSIDSIKQWVANPGNEHLLWAHYDLKEQMLKYKISFKDNFFGALNIVKEEYVKLYNDILTTNIKESIGSAIINTSEHLDLLLEEYKDHIPFVNEELIAGYSTYDVLKSVLGFTKKCAEDFKSQKKGIVPKCLWDHNVNPAMAYYAGFIDAAWEGLEMVVDLYKFKAAWDPLDPFFLNAEAYKIRQQTIDIVVLIRQLDEEDKLVSSVTDTIKKEFGKYVDETLAFDPQARYNQGKLIFDVASLFIGYGEVKVFLKTGKITSTTFKALQAIPSKLQEMVVGIGKLSKKVLVKIDNITGDILIEGQRIATLNKEKLTLYIKALSESIDENLQPVGQLITPEGYRVNLDDGTSISDRVFNIIEDAKGKYKAAVKKAGGVNNAGGEISNALRSKIFNKLPTNQADELILELGKNSGLKAAMESGEISSLAWKKIADGIPSFRIDKPNDYLTCLKKMTQYEKGIGGSGTVKYYRVQGGGSGSATSRELLVLEANGNMSFADKTKELYFSTDNIDHAAYYVNGTGTNINGKVITKTPANRPNGTIVEFKVPKWLDDKLKQDAIPQHKSGSNALNNNSPQIVDYNQPGNPFGIKESWQTLIEENYIKGSVKVIE